MHGVGSESEDPSAEALVTLEFGGLQARCRGLRGSLGLEDGPRGDMDSRYSNFPTGYSFTVGSWE